MLIVSIEYLSKRGENLLPPKMGHFPVTFSSIVISKLYVVFNTSLKMYNMLAEDVCALSIINLSQAHTLAYECNERGYMYKD